MESALFVQVLHILHGRNIAFQGGSNALRADSDRTTHELGYVVALHELAMVVGISRWQFERFRTMPVLVHVGYEGARVYAIGTTTREHHPTSCGRPSVVALDIIGIDFLQWTYELCIAVGRLARMNLLKIDEVDHP